MMEYKELNRKCPICQNEKGKVLYKINMDLLDKLPIPSEYDVVACENCGFTYADVDSTQEIYNIYYRDYNIYSENNNVKQNNEEVVADDRYTIFSKYVSKDAKIIDMGCGDGDWLVFLQRNGYKNIYGIDPSEKSVQKIRNNGIDGRTGNIFDTVPEKLMASFDVISCSMVLEHIYDVGGAIEQFKKYIKPEGGMIFLTVPAVEGFAKYYMEIPNYFNHEHINYFSLQTLDNLMRVKGFTRVCNSKEALVSGGKADSIEMAIEALYINNSEYSDKKIQKDDVSQKSIENYVEEAEKHENAAITGINEFVKSSPKGIVVWGSGAYLARLMSKVPELKEKIAFMVDNNENKWNMEFEGRKVCPPSILKKANYHYPILICSMKNAPDICKQIKKMGIKNRYYIA